MAELTERARRAKYDLVRLLLYRRHYGDLHPPDYSRSRFREAASHAGAAYKSLADSIGAEALDEFDQRYSHPYWTEQKASFAGTLLRGLPEDFLDDPIVRPNMVRRGWGPGQVEELRHLESRPADIRELLSEFRESRVGRPFLECSEYRCSSTSLGHLYYLMRILEAFPVLRERPHVVVELGGGYGNFARVYRLLVPNARYIVVDFPQFLALQQLYLNLNDDRAELVADPEQLSDETQLTLLPVQYLADAHVKADLFVSHFALSETPAALQELVAHVHFFDADHIYLTGQRTGAQPGHSWSPHERLQDLVSHEFGEVTIDDFNVSWAYELVGTRSAKSAAPPLVRP